MSAMRDSGWWVFVNPASGGGRTRRRWPALRAEFERRALPYRVLETATPGHATRLAAAMADGRTRRVDLGLATCHSRDGSERRTVVFHNAAGAGLDAEVARLAPGRGARAPAYLIGLVRALGRFRPPQFAVRAGDADRAGRCLTVIAAIGPRLGGGMRVAPAALPDDGWLELVMVAELSWLRAFALAPGLWDGRAAADAAFRHLRCRTALLVSDPPCEVEADGQCIGWTPLELAILPGALTALDCRRERAPRAAG